MNSTVPVTISGFWIFLADALPVGGVGEQPLVRLEILFVLDVLGQRERLRRRSAAADGGRAAVGRRRRGRRRRRFARRLCSLAMSISGSMSASMTRSDDLVRSWLRSSRTVSWFASTSSLPPATKPATSTRWNGVTSSFGWIGVSIGIS